jgi:hypothetical protein
MRTRRDAHGNDVDWLARYYAPLRGARIDDLYLGEDDLTPVLRVRLTDGTQLEVGILCDPEGNGPGFIDNLPRPKPVK